MLSRIINPAIRTLRLNNKFVLAPTVRFASGKYFPPQVSMDDCPVPCGDWKTQHKSDETKSNMILGGSIAFMIVTLIFVKISGLVDLNYNPPNEPAA